MLSTYIIIPDKIQEIIIKNVLELWISVYEDHNGGDNGEEFVNEEIFRTAQFGITMKRTSIESARSNGIVEKHNLILREMLKKSILA